MEVIASSSPFCTARRSELAQSASSTAKMRGFVVPQPRARPREQGSLPSTAGEVVSAGEVVVLPGGRQRLESADLVQVGCELHGALRVEVPILHPGLLEDVGQDLRRGPVVVDLPI